MRHKQWDPTPHRNTCDNKNVFSNRTHRHTRTHVEWKHGCAILSTNLFSPPLKKSFMHWTLNNATLHSVQVNSNSYFTIACNVSILSKWVVVDNHLFYDFWKTRGDFHWILISCYLIFCMLLNNWFASLEIFGDLLSKNQIRITGSPLMWKSLFIFLNFWVKRIRRKRFKPFPLCKSPPTHYRIGNLMNKLNHV